MESREAVHRIRHCRIDDQEEAVSVSSKCDLESDHTRLGRCLRPWLDLWEMIRVREAYAADIVFPMPFYSRESVLLLCGAYVKSREECMASKVMEQCHNNEMVVFVQSHMRYFCGKNAQIALTSFDCIKRALSSQRRCLHFIEGVPLPTHQIGKCSGMAKFFDCVRSDVEKKCGINGHSILVDAITTFGCELSTDVVEEAAKYIAKLNVTGQFTENAGKKYIRSELATIVPLLDNDQHGVETVTYLYDIPAISTRGPGILLATDRQAQHGTGAAAPINFDERITMDALMGKYFSDDKLVGEYRRTPIRKTDAFDYIEGNTFLDSDPNVEIAFNEDSQQIQQQRTLSVSNERCDEKSQSRLAQCYSPLMKRWEAIHKQSITFDEVLFPLFNYSSSEVRDICELLEATLEHCLSSQLLTNCQHNELVELMDQQLGVICSQVTPNGLTESYTCLRSVLFSNQDCFALIPGRNIPGMRKTRKCEHMPQFYDCMQEEVNRRCGAESHEVFVSIIHNYGCPLKITKPVAPAGEFSSNTLDEIAAKEGSIEQQGDSSNERLSIRNHTRDIKILEGELFSYVLSAECTQDIRDKARICVAPLMRTWIHLREQRPELSQISFPMYRYTRTELLELCDGYANLFLCAGFESITRCLNDELVKSVVLIFGTCSVPIILRLYFYSDIKVRFARDHLGYICTPQNIERFMKKHDCLMQLEMLNVDNCRQFIEGVAEPSKDQAGYIRKCRGVKQYYECMKPNILRRCDAEALNEFEQSLEEFGCHV
uniref:Uncharacterized protein n=1 Tax=Ascaris lumbricoides TaxID=6252 RepID=A0A9J2Q0F2_ASCLU